MPLLRRQPFVKQKPPADLTLDEEVFHCSLTNEVFRDYEKFFERVILCNSLVWTCAISGRPGLTYQEALDSENRARKQLASFPDQLARVVLYLASITRRRRLNEINDDVFVFVKDRFFIGEVVEVVEGGSRKMCKVIKVIAPRGGEENNAKAEDTDGSDDVICLDDPADQRKSSNKKKGGSSGMPTDPHVYQYVVQELKKPNIYIVLAPQISRKKGIFTRDKCKLYLKQHCDSSQRSDGFWKVKTWYFNKFKLSTVQFEEFFDGPPPTFAISQMKNKPVAAKTKMSTSSVIDLTDDDVVMQEAEPKNRVQTEKLPPQKSKAKQITDREKLEMERIAKKEEMKRMWEEEKLRRKEEKAKEREQKRVEKIQRDAYLKEWSRSRDDLECDDLKDLPAASPVHCPIPLKLFGECLMVLEYFHCFSSLLELKKTFPSGISHVEFCKALQETSVDNLFADVLHFLLKSIFNVQQQEEEDEEMEATNANNRRMPEEQQKNATYEELVEQATAASQLPQNNYAAHLHKLPLDNFTLTEVLRLHLLASGARSTNLRYQYQQRGGYTPHDDAALEFRHGHLPLMHACAEWSVFDLDAADKLKIVSTLIHQLLTFVPCRDLVEESFEKLRNARNDLRQHQLAEQKRGRDEANFWYKKKLEERLREQGNTDGVEITHTEEPVPLQKLDLTEHRKSERAGGGRNLLLDDMPTENIDWNIDETSRALLRERCEARERRLNNIIEQMQRGRAICPLGRDRTYRRYWLFDSIAGLFVEDDDETVPPEALQMVAQQQPASGADATTGGGGDKNSSSDKENDSFDSTSPSKKLDNSHKDAGDTTTTTALDNRVSAHDQIATRGTTTWSFYNTDAQLDHLLETLNSRGFREGPLKMALLEQKDQIRDSMRACSTESLIRDSGMPSGDMTAQQVLELNLREMLLDVEEKIYVGTLGCLKVKDRSVWRTAIEDGYYDPQSSEFTAESKKVVTENHTSEMNGEVKPTRGMPVKDLAKALLQIQMSVESRFLKRPLGTADPSSRKSKKKKEEEEAAAASSVSDVLQRWQACVLASTSLSQLFLHLSVLERSVTWLRSALNARCRLCRRKTDGEHMLLCDGCDRGHHMYCLKPPVTKIPHGDWFCPYCQPKEVVCTPRKNRRSFIEQDEEEEEQVEEEEGEVSQSEDEVVESDEDMDSSVAEDDDDDNEGVQVEDDDNVDDSVSEEVDESVASENSDEEQEVEVEPTPAKIKLVKKKWTAPAPSSGRSTPSSGVEASGRNKRGTSRGNRSLDTAAAPQPKTKPRTNRSLEPAPRSRNSLEPVLKTSKAKAKPSRHSIETDRPSKQAKQPAKKTVAAKRKLEDDDVIIVSAKVQKQTLQTKSRSIETLSVMRQCEALVQELSEKDEAWPFLTPVTKRDAPDYFDIIAKPMDFSRIRIKINKFEYTQASDLLDDIRLIFANCQQYNMPTTPEYIAAQKMAQLFRKRLKDTELIEHVASTSSNGKGAAVSSKKGQRINAR